MSQAEVLKRPESAVPALRALRGHAERGARIVSFSTHGGPTSGNCAVVCCILADVFGFDFEALSCLEDGYLMWRRWAEANASAAERLRLKYGSS